MLAAITPATRLVFLTSPNNPTGMLIPHDDIRALAARCRTGCVFLDEAYVDFTATRTSSRCSPACPTSSSAGRSRRRTGWPACASVLVARAARRSTRLRRSCPPYSINVAAAAALVAALADRHYLAWYRDQVAESRDARLRGVRRLGLPLLAERGQLRARPRRRSTRARGRRGAGGAAASSSAIGRPQPGCAGCVRITAGVVDAHPGVPRRRSRRSCAPRGNRSTNDGDADRADDRPRRARDATRAHGHPVPRSHAGAVRAARRVRPHASPRPATSTSISTTRSRTSASRSARPSRRRSATAAASTAPATS